MVIYPEEMNIIYQGELEERSIGQKKIYIVILLYIAILNYNAEKTQ